MLFPLNYGMHIRIKIHTTFFTSLHSPHSSRQRDMWARSQYNAKIKSHIANANRSRELNSLRWFPYALFCVCKISSFFFVYLCSSLGAKEERLNLLIYIKNVKWMINEFISMNHHRHRSLVFVTIIASCLWIKK